MMKKRFSRVTAMLLALMMTLALAATSSTTANAGYTIDTTLDGKASLTLTKYYGDKDTGSTAGANEVGYTLYLVGYLKQDTTATGTEVYYVDGSNAKIDVSTLDPDTYDTSNAIKTVTEELTNSSGEISFTDLDFGLYLAVETTSPATVTSAKNFFVQIPQSTDSGWVYDVTAEPKNSITDFDGTLTKTFADGSYTKSVYAGTTVNYKVTTTLPTGIEGYTKYDIIDTPSSYITLDDTSFVVKYDGTELSSGYTVTESGGVWTISFDSTTIATWVAGKVVTIEYTGKVAKDAPTNTALTNDIEIDYTDPTGNPGTKDPDPKDPTEPEDPDTNPNIPSVYTYGYQFTKVGSDDISTGLAGAEFVVKSHLTNRYYQYDDSVGLIHTVNIDRATRFISDENGYVKINGLIEGTYTIIEVKAPDGYVLLKDSFEITISADSSNGSSIITVVNQKDGSTELPTTGGNGIYLFLIVGAALIVTATALYIKSRKRNNAAQ